MACSSAAVSAFAAHADEATHTTASAVLSVGAFILLGPQLSPTAMPTYRTIVALGDSTTAGTPGFQSPIEAPPDGRGDVTSQYAYWLMNTHPEWRVLNRGVNGQRTDQIHARFDPDVLEARPHAVVIIAGVNDIYQGRSAGAVTRELEGMYDIARAAAIPI